MGYFPHPYPDEIFYSVCARYVSHMGFRVQSNICQSLVGTVQGTIGLDLPNNLNYLFSQLPSGYGVSVDDVIDKWTLFNCFAPFLGEQRAEELRLSMGGASRKNSLKTGIVSGRVPCLDYLRYCPRCNAEDVKAHGEPYWHRVHQIQGVEVCPKHGALLRENSERMSWRGLLPCKSFVNLDCSQHETTELTKTERALLRKIASGLEWLLKNGPSIKTPRTIRSHYAALIKKRTIFRLGKTIHFEVLRQQISESYPKRILQRLHCECDYLTHKGWVSALFNCNQRFQAPVRHVLLMDFLGYSPKRFFESIGSVAPIFP